MPVGQRGAEQIISSGKVYSAEEMLALGVVDAVAEDGKGEAEVAELIKRRARMRNGLAALAATRRRVWAATASAEDDHSAPALSPSFISR